MLKGILKPRTPLDRQESYENRKLEEWAEDASKDGYE